MTTETTFSPIGRWGTKVRCDVCGRSGYPDDPGTPRASPSWQDACRKGHPYECPCGRRFSTKQGLQRHRGHEAQALRDHDPAVSPELAQRYLVDAHFHARVHLTTQVLARFFQGAPRRVIVDAAIITVHNLERATIADV